MGQSTVFISVPFRISPDPSPVRKLQYYLEELSCQVMQTLRDFAVYYKIIIPFMYFDNSVTCKVTASRGARDWQLNRGEEIFTKSKDRSEICTCIFHAFRSMTATSTNLYTLVFSCHSMHSRSGYECIYVLSMLLGQIYIYIHTNE